MRLLRVINVLHNEHSVVKLLKTPVLWIGVGTGFHYLEGYPFPSRFTIWLSMIDLNFWATVFIRFNEIETVSFDIGIGIGRPFRGVNRLLAPASVRQELIDLREKALATSLSIVRFDFTRQSIRSMPLSSEQYQALVSECAAKRISSVGELAVSMSKYPGVWERLLGEPMTMGLRLRCSDALRDITDLDSEGIFSANGDEGPDDEVQDGTDTDSVTI